MNKTNLKNWLNKSFKIEMTDGRILIGIFLCTDRDGNIILGSCHEYHKSEGRCFVFQSIYSTRSS